MLSLIILLDISVVLLCIAILLRNGDLIFLHPATIYLMFHVLVVTLRLLSINAGAPTMFSDPLYRRAGYASVTIDEIIKAGLYADLGLFISTMGFVVAGTTYRKRKKWAKKQQKQRQDLAIYPPLYLPVMWVTFFIGIVGLIFNSFLPGAESPIIETVAVGEWRNSSWVFITQMWVGIALIGFIYVYGFRRILMILMVLYLSLQIYQGFHRFRIVLPLIVLVNIYLLQHKLRWPRRWMLFAGILVVLLFLTAKHVGRMMQESTPLNEIVDATFDDLTNLPTRSVSDLVFLDQFAVGLSLVDRSGHFYYGTGYLPLITLPIPRVLWPDKPGIAFFLDEIQTVERPVGKLGMILTYLGEAYVNFGVVGILVIPFVLSYGLGRYFYGILNKPYNSITVLIYLIVLSSLIQVYRDGLTSLVLFTLVNYMPIAFIVVLHYLFVPTYVKDNPHDIQMPDKFLPNMKTQTPIIGDKS